MFLEHLTCPDEIHNRSVSISYVIPGFESLGEEFTNAIVGKGKGRGKFMFVRV